MSITEIPLVSTYRQVAEHATRTDATAILDQARAIRATDTDEPSAHSSAIDTASRELLVELIASRDIESDDFSPVWALLDAINLLCDHDLCEPALTFWLVEDLLDSQTINGCRNVFNYLESRRERMTKVNFKHKHLPILRCCNDLLRRLSRAEDTVFCGRVFIYLFQSFPLGDKSSVNLRGEFHQENLTSYDDLPQDAHPDTSMQVDAPAISNLDHLYPVFWSMQSLFSSPTKLFEHASMLQFKHAIKQTMTCFTNVATNAAPATLQDPERRPLKRKRADVNGEHNDLLASTFNPKYLTNRDLFDLELHDIDFRRHVLVQALILLDFLVSLSAQSKAKLSTVNQSKSIMSALYDKYTLSEDDRLWAIDTRKTIEHYLEHGNGTEGRYYLRMVNMVLSRDKNWTLWKAEGCPPIARTGVDPSVVDQSEQSLQDVGKTANAPLMKPKGYDRLAFLSHHESAEALKERPLHVPSLEDYYKGIQSDHLDLDFATDEEKKDIEERKAGKLWRALRSARGKRFTLCEELKNGENLDALIGRVKDEATQDQEPDQETAPTQDQVAGDATTESPEKNEAKPEPIEQDT